MKTLNENYRLIHPLDDVPEKKVDVSQLGPIQMAPSVRFSLFALKAYLLVMALLVVYKVAEMGGLTQLATSR